MHPTRLLAAAAALASFAPCAHAQYHLVGEFTPPGVQAGDRFGAAVAAGTNWIVYGAPGDDTAGAEAGAAWVQAQPFGAFTHRLVATTGEAEDRLGSSVAVYLDRVALGMTATLPIARSVYVFDAVTGAQVFELQAPVPSTTDNFGAAVGLSGQFVLVGAPGDDEVADDSGAIYVFSAQTGAFLFKRKAPAPAAFANFGASVALDGNLALVGEPGWVAGLQGNAYLFDLTVDVLLDTLSSPCGCGVGFGDAVAIDVPHLAVRSPGDNRVYVYPLSGATPTELVPVGAESGFGLDLAVSGGGVVVSYFPSSAPPSAYVYSADDGRILDELPAPVPHIGDAYGFRVAMSVWGAVIGSPDFSNAQSGAGYGHAYDGCPKDRYCSPAAQNSTGWSGTIDLDGCALGGSILVRADHLPSGQFGYLLVGNGKGVVHPAGSAGTLCLGGSTPGIGRYVADVANTGSAGTLATDIVLGHTGQGTGELPHPPGGTLTAGQTWNFQYWYRDQGSSNFTDAITVLFL